MEEFNNKTDPNASLFLTWWEDQLNVDNKYVLNCTSPREWMIHHGHCPHFAYNTPVNLSSTPKICSPDRRKLEARAKKETGHPPRKCKTCME